MSTVLWNCHFCTNFGLGPCDWAYIYIYLFSIFLSFLIFSLFLYGWRSIFEKTEFLSLEYIYQRVDKIILMYFWGLMDSEFNSICSKIEQIFLLFKSGCFVKLISLCPCETKEDCYDSVGTIVSHHLLGQCLHCQVTRTCPVNCLSMHDSLKALKAHLSNERRVQKFLHWNAQLSSSTSTHPVDERRSKQRKF